ncbi:hypothetical protein DFR57_102177 [Saliterribacillus persicus]|uniref:Uncharacterized protein n=1 Tax=Saliterribacillus persicus TaxID=930114 RepID=A0A368Y9L8_9BACI|nr:hypothetical protein DFR57_102177 [Saliterribacillus persicus]
MNKRDKISIISWAVVGLMVLAALLKNLLFQDIAFVDIRNLTLFTFFLGSIIQLSYIIKKNQN